MAGRYRETGKYGMLIMMGQVDRGKNKKGRCRKRWFDSVQDDFRRMIVTNWRDKAMDIREWSRILDEAVVKLRS